jgi:hypothetical protein
MAESDKARVDADTVPSLFGEVRVKLVENRATPENKRLSSEIWRSFVLFALLFMVIESILLLLETTSRKVDHGFNRSSSGGAPA